MMIRRGADGTARLILFPESYWIARELETSAVCEQKHPILAMQTMAGVWFAVCVACDAAVLAGPDILDLLKVAEFPKAQPAKATIAEDILIEAGE